MKKDLTLIEHNLIPLALIAANFCLAHLFYLISTYKPAECTELLLVIVLAIMLTTGIYRKNKLFLLISVSLYFLVLITSLLN